MPEPPPVTSARRPVRNSVGDVMSWSVRGVARPRHAVVALGVVVGGERGVQLAAVAGLVAGCAVDHVAAGVGVGGVGGLAVAGGLGLGHASLLGLVVPGAPCGRQVTAAPRRLLVRRRGVTFDRFLPGQRHVLEGGAGVAVVAGARSGGDVLLDAVAACRVGHAGHHAQPEGAETTDGCQNAASSTSMSALSVCSAMTRSAVSFGSTWVQKNRVAASFPS